MVLLPLSSRFGQSYEPTDFCKTETVGSQQTMEPTRRRQESKSGGFNSGKAKWLLGCIIERQSYPRWKGGNEGKEKDRQGKI